MDFELDADQIAIMEAVERLLEEHAGAGRAIALQADDGYDDVLHRALAESGFLDVAVDPDMGLLEAALVTEAVTRAGGVVAVGTACLMAAQSKSLDATQPIALVEAKGLDHPIRFASMARTLVVIGPEDVRSFELRKGDVETVPSNFGYPMGRVVSDLGQGETVADLSPGRAMNLWRLALATEAVGTMEAALAVTVAYVKVRRQFGRAIGSFQAVQHRLAACVIQIEGARWLAREASHLNAPGESVAAAASFAIAAGQHIFEETHQLSGAIGFTREHDLHVWSMRLQALRLELGGASAHRRSLAAARWRTPL